jgi:hypothetical protein
VSVDAARMRWPGQVCCKQSPCVTTAFLGGQCCDRDVRFRNRCVAPGRQAAKARPSSFRSASNGGCGRSACRRPQSGEPGHRQNGCRRQQPALPWAPLDQGPTAAAGGHSVGHQVSKVGHSTCLV